MLETLVAGFFRCAGGKPRFSNAIVPFDNLIFSDYDTSIFTDPVIVVCGNKTYDFRKAPRCVCSDGRRIYLLCETVLSVMEKVSGSSCDLSSHHVECVACSDNFVFCVTVEKQCFRLVEDPCGTYIFKSISNLDRLKIKSVACGADFILCLTVTGQIYSQGIGSRGQLGLEDLDDRDEFTFIEALAPVTITRISAGKWHAACVTDTGDLYTWGWNEFGQLGLPSVKLRKSDTQCKQKDLSGCDSVVCCPRLVDMPQDAGVVEVSCGSRHTVCLTEHGHVYAFGWNGFGQLGVHMSIKASDVPVLVKLPDDKCPVRSVKSVFCGLWSTIVVVEK